MLSIEASNGEVVCVFGHPESTIESSNAQEIQCPDIHPNRQGDCMQNKCDEVVTPDIISSSRRMRESVRLMPRLQSEG